MTETPCEICALYETQVETIHRYQRENDRQGKRIEKLQGMVDWLQANKAHLEAQLTPEALANRMLFNEQ